ncbi:cation:proton antiporter [Streptomyces sp. NPDC053048]|uniref:cation:proton antiporter n=1 Tax=Streptomyces sp. NPDC053048 TaxID=3365694 RepID=UPI0037D3C89F
MIFADIAVILLIGVVISPLRTRLRQPVVVGEIAAGLLLGPSVLGLLPGDVPGLLFPEAARPHLSTIAQVGIALFMFIAGWELDFHPLRGRFRSVLTITAVSLALPFLLAVVTAVALVTLHPTVTTSRAPAGVFAVFMGIVLSISALSVLVRIIKENGFHNTQVGTIATACGAITETIAWCSAVVLFTAARGEGVTPCLRTLVQVALYALVMVCLIRPLLHRFLRRDSAAEHQLLPILVISSGVLLSSCVTAHLGIHAVLGAFAFGLVMPRDISPDLHRSLEAPFQHTGTLLIPVFFALTGLSVDITELGPVGALALIAFLCIAWAGKFAGTFTGARLAGFPQQESTVLATFLNTRGLSEVIMLTLGHNAGIINDEIFTAMLLTALLATASVNPLVRLLATRSLAASATMPVQAVHEAVETKQERTT